MPLACSWSPLLSPVLATASHPKGERRARQPTPELQPDSQALCSVIQTQLSLTCKHCRISWQKGGREKQEADKVPSALLSKRLKPGLLRCLVRLCMLQS